jgi:DNA-binding transcriptional ArsR family regulator
MPDRDFIVAPSASPVVVRLEPAHNVMHTLLLLYQAEHISGLDEWVMQAASALTPQERARNELVIVGLHFAVMPQQSWPSFPAYLDHLAASDPETLRDKMIDVYARIPPLGQCEGQMWTDESPAVDLQTILRDVDSYLGFLRERFCAEAMDEELESQAYGYVVDPPALKALIVSHLRDMWERYLAPEWERVEPMLRDAVRAFGQVDLSDKTKVQAARLIAGQEMDEEKWAPILDRVERVVFVPSAHVGPYLGKFCAGGSTLWVMFGARLPEGSAIAAPDLSRAEILVRLSALAESNRLRILKLVSDRGEQSSQDVIANLDLSQSTVSRHLKQLTATGYLSERRCEGAKCYQLNPQRVRDTLQAISAFLLGE